MTLNQVVNRLQNLSNNHKQINTFLFGDMVEFLANGEVTYPALFVDMTTGDISRDKRATTWNFDLWFCDLVNVAANARTNELEVFSDLTSIAEDFKAMLVYSGYEQDWSITDTSALNYYKEKFEDIVGAVKMSVTISVRFDSNRCVVPTLQQFEYGTAIVLPPGVTMPGADDILNELGLTILTEAGDNLTMDYGTATSAGIDDLLSELGITLSTETGDNLTMDYYADGGVTLNYFLLEDSTQLLTETNDFLILEQ